MEGRGGSAGHIWIDIKRTSSICAHARSSHGIVLVKAALFNELLRHNIAGGEEDLWPAISQCSCFCCFVYRVEGVTALAVCVAFDGSGSRESYTCSNCLRK